MNKDLKWLKRYCDVEIKSVRRAVDKVESTNKEAVDKVERNYQDYRQQQNEWRGQIKDQSGMFVTRKELVGAIVSTAAIFGVLFTILVYLLNKN